MVAANTDRKNTSLRRSGVAKVRCPAANTVSPLTTPHLPNKGDDMALSKLNHASDCGTNSFFLELFRNRSASDERERIWQSAVSHAGESTPPLRFPIYESLYLLNVYAQKIVDLQKS